mgnify:FL=1
MTSIASETIMVTLLDPTSPPRELSNPLANGLNDIKGKTLGFLWNNKPNGDKLFRKLEFLIKERYDLNQVIYKQKPTASIPAKSEIIEELAAKCDMVIVGLAD